MARIVLPIYTEEPGFNYDHSFYIKSDKKIKVVGVRVRVWVGKTTVSKKVTIDFAGEIVSRTFNRDSLYDLTRDEDFYFNNPVILSANVNKRLWVKGDYGSNYDYVAIKTGSPSLPYNKTVDGISFTLSNSSNGYISRFSLIIDE